MHSYLINISTGSQKKKTYIREFVMIVEYIMAMIYSGNNGNDFVWVDGTDLTYTDWKSGEPNEVRNCSPFYHSKIEPYIINLYLRQHW